MLSIQRLGRRSFEVFQNGMPIGLVKFLRESRQWSFRPYPTPTCHGVGEERRDPVLRNLLCPQGERCVVDRTVRA